MKQYLKIQNDGILDVRLIDLMGGTTKSTQQHKIGQFGTGLKYVLAYMVREGIDFNIWIDGERIKIGCKEEVIKEELFKVVTINGKQTSITDKMGLDWKPWMIIRELYSNALDEGGASYEITEWDDELGDNEGKTSFFIELTTDFLRVYNDWDKYFIVNKIPMYENDKFALHPTTGHLKIYKQGILIHEDEKQRALFSYDIKNADINELREYRGTISNDISRIIFDIDDPKVVQYFLENVNEQKEEDKDLFEANVDLEWWQDYRKMNKAWKETLAGAKVIHKEAKEKIITKEANIDLSHTITVPKNLYKSLTRSFKGVGALRLASKMNEFFEIHDEELTLKLKQCITILEQCSYFIHPELTFLFGEFGDKRTLAKIDSDKKEVMVSQKMKDKSLFEFCAMLVEENEHFQTGFTDESRQFQQHFIDLYTRTMLDKAEVKI